MESEHPIHPLPLPSSSTCKLLSWSVGPGKRVRKGTVLCSYTQDSSSESEESRQQLKSTTVGVVKELLAQPGGAVQPGTPVIVLEEKCDHSIVVFDMCADCGLNLRRHPNTRGVLSQPVAANVSMIHGIPEIRISQKEAEVLGHKDKLRLLESRKLALVVDLDQTLIHTSVDPNIEPGLPDVYGFNLPGHPMVYHCRLRPYARQFLEKVSQFYEMHVFTMGTKSYAASVTHILDPEKRLFCDRIISRDEFFDPHSKALRLKSVFPCGDSMVAIIDDREDVWGRCPNLVHVKPYIFFAGTADINAPPSHSTPPTPTTPHSPSHTPKGQTLPPARPCFPPAHVPLKMRHISNAKEKGSTKQPPSQLIQSHRHHVPSQQEGPETKAPEGEEGAERTDSSRPHTPLESLLLAGTEEANDHKDPPQSDDTSQSSSPDRQSISGNTNTNNSKEDGGAAGGPGNSGKDKEGDGRDSGSSSSSSSSDSDSEDSSSSSGIDDNLFEHLGEEEEEEEAKKCQGRENGPGEGEPTEEERGQRAVTQDQGNDKQQAGEEMDISVSASERPSDTKNDHPATQESTPSNQDDHTADLSEQKAKRKALEIHDPDDFLLYLGDTLERLHTAFYTQYDEMSKNADITARTDIPTPDLKEMIPNMRQSVLKGAKILFTGVIPTNMPQEKSPEWNTARAFGATIHDRLVPGLNSSDPRQMLRATTHVIVGKPGTTKLKEAKWIPGMKVVNPRWLWSCAERWKWVDERLFPVEGEQMTSMGRDRKREESPKKLAKVRAAHNRKHPPKECSTRKGGNPETKSRTTSELQSHDSKQRGFERHLSLDSQLSVSDEELEAMEAEVDAELDGSSSSSEDGNGEQLGSYISQEGDSNDLSYDSFAGEAAERLLPSRKRKHADVEDSSSSNSPSSNSLVNVESVEQSEESGSSDESGDELAALLEENDSGSD